MPKQAKTTAKVSERSTKGEILEAYQDLLDKATDITDTDAGKQDQAILDSAAKETVENVTNDLSKLRISANQTISSLTEKLTSEAERFSTLQKAIAIAKNELEEIDQIKVRAGMLKRMIELQKTETEKFEKDIAEKRAVWEEEQKAYEEQLKKQRKREEEEYDYQKTLRARRERDAFEEEKRVWEQELQENKKQRADQIAELEELRKKATSFPLEIERAVKNAVSSTLVQEKKEAQIRANFSKQESDARQQISALKISSLEQTVKAQSAEIEELKRQFEKATQQVKDIAVKVIEGAHKEPSVQSKSADQASK